MAAADERANLKHLGDMAVEAVVELGRKRMKLSQVRRLREKDVIELDKLAGERHAIRINGALFAEGEMIVLDDKMGCRLTRMVEPHVEEEEEDADEESEHARATSGLSEAASPEEERNRREMILIPSGPFTMGSSDYDAPVQERRAHTVYLDIFFIDRFPVTNLQYREFVLVTGHRPPVHWGRGTYPVEIAQHPVTHVSWHDARAYAEWAGKRLPTEAEWEKAARGTDERRYPWGNRYSEGKYCNANNAMGTTTPVNKYPDGRSPYEAWDMCGNVYEWCADYYAENYYQRSPDSDPRGPDGGQERVVRGGSYMDTRAGLPCTHRASAPEDETRDSIGFRCAMDA